MYENKLYKDIEKKLTGLLVMIGGFFAKNIIILLYLLGDANRLMSNRSYCGGISEMI